MIRRPPRSTRVRSSAASDVYKRQAQMTGRVGHVLPAALLIWAVETYRRPMIAGALMGLAISCNYFPLFLLPLWFSFYWHRGLLRFGAGVLATLLVMVASLAF